MLRIQIIYKTGSIEELRAGGMRLDEGKVDITDVVSDRAITKQYPKGVQMETHFLSVELSTIDRIGVA